MSTSRDLLPDSTGQLHQVVSSLHPPVHLLLTVNHIHHPGPGVEVLAVVSGDTAGQESLRGSEGAETFPPSPDDWCVVVTGPTSHQTPHTDIIVPVIIPHV